MNYFILLTQPYTKEDSISLFGKYIGIFLLEDLRRSSVLNF